MSTGSEIDALKAVDEALSVIDDEAKIRVLNWANSKFLGKSMVHQELKASPAAHNTNTDSIKTVKSKTPKKSKVVIKQVKDLNLSPTGKTSAVAFAAEKKPSNVKQKCVVALYYLLTNLDLEKAGIDHIYTFFKAVGWPAPTDFANTLHQAGTEGWLDTATAADIKITPIGENVVEHQLPKKIGS